VKPCPYCAKANEDYAQACPFCGRNLVAQASAPGVYSGMPPGNTETSGKAIGSLVCGILFFFLPAAIAAVVLGHLSLSEIRQSAGRLAGRGMAIAGLVLGYLGLSFIPILIIAAIAIPNLLRAKMAANEASAVGSLRTINTGCATYATEHKSFPSALISEVFASGQKSGYLFTYEPGPSQDGAIISYEVHADPATPGATGQRYFFTDQTGIIRYSLRGQANSESPPLQ
jgi:type IV pilus assembly protein PilA